VVEDHGSLVVGAGGWLRLDPELLAAGGISRRARARPVPEGVLLTRANGHSDSDRGARGSPATGVAAADLAADGPPRARSSPARLRLEGIGRARGQGAARRQVIEGVTLEFAPGALTLVLGRSGAGKTTLLELVGLLEAPSSGELVLDGHRLGVLDSERRAALRRARIGYLPQEPVPVGFLSAAENVALALRIRGRPVAEASARAREALTEVGLDDLRRQRVARLSAGEAQRVALARALACARGLLVVDEPTSRLDEGNAVVVGQLLRRAAEDHGQTVICATHDPALLPLADAVVELASGPTAPPGPQSSTVRNVNVRP
jgi:ABC-type lipoprotein export system ATPase subunit